MALKLAGRTPPSLRRAAWMAERTRAEQAVLDALLDAMTRDPKLTVQWDVPGDDERGPDFKYADGTEVWLTSDPDRAT